MILEPTETEDGCVVQEEALVHTEVRADSVSETGVHENQIATVYNDGAENMMLHIAEAEWTVKSMINMVHILYTRQDLINAMFRMRNLFIDEEVIMLLHDSKQHSVSEVEAVIQAEQRIGMITGMNIENGVVTVELPFDTERSELWYDYGKLVAGIIKQAKASNRTKAIRMTTETGKYHANNWLFRLGFFGPEHKELRHALMGHLSGYAAFKNDSRMQKHRDRLAEQRRIKREMNAEANRND